MINTTRKIIINERGEALKESILAAIADTKNIIYGFYSNGNRIPPSEITSTSFKDSPTYNLGYCKYFDENNSFFDGLELSEEDYIHECYNLIIRKTKSTIKSHFSKVIPYFSEISHKLALTMLNSIKRSIAVFLFSLWSRGSIILTSYFVLPGTKKGANAEKIILCDTLYTEVIGFFQSYRMPTIGGGDTRLKHHKELPRPLVTSIQNYAWRMILSTDWHCIEDVNTEDCHTYLNAVNNASKSKFNRDVDIGPIPTPVREMLSLLESKFPERVKFKTADFNKARSAIQHREQLKAQSLMTRIKQENGNLKTRDDKPPKNNITVESPIFPMNPLNSSDELLSALPDQYALKQTSIAWITWQRKYIFLKKKRGMASWKHIGKTLKKLNQYLFEILPNYFMSNAEEHNKVPMPHEFTRLYLDSDNSHPTLVECICSTQGSNTAYKVLAEIDQFFNYLALSTEHYSLEDRITNPFIRRLDFPRIARRYGTNKKTFAKKHLSPFIGYTYSVSEFLYYVSKEILVEQNSRIIDIIKNECFSSHKKDRLIETESFGYVPFFHNKGENLFIKKIPLELFAFTYRKNQDGRVPNLIHIHQTILSLETGIRAIHIKWLESRAYDKFIDRDTQLPAVCQLEVSSDKVKTKPWVSHVSNRVIRVLDRQKELNELMDTEYHKKEFWYNHHEGSEFGKISPLFPSGGIRNKPDTPCNNSATNKNFRGLLKAFQDYSNRLNLFEDKIEWVWTCEKNSNKNISDLSAHGCRATVISEHIKVLPPDIIGKYITGHESAEIVSYYCVVDPDYIKETSDNQSSMIFSSDSLSQSNNDYVAINAEELNSKLRKAIDLNMESALHDFGATSFERKKSNGSLESGVSIAKDISTSQLAHNSTHICPYNNLCTDVIIKEVGEFNCGKCWASIKTVDHIPRITAHIRSLHEKHDELLGQIKHMIDSDVSESIINIHEEKRIAIASEESAWIVSLSILTETSKDISKRDKFLVGKPELVEKHLKVISTDHSPLSNLILKLNDAKSYPEYFTPQLTANITRIRNKILAQSGDLDKLIHQPSGFQLLDEFRGLIRGICEATETSIEDLSKAMNTNLPQDNNRNLLEVL